MAQVSHTEVGSSREVAILRYNLEINMTNLLKGHRERESQEYFPGFRLE